MIYLFILVLVTIAIWNAYVILWKTENSKKYSKIWHAVGLILRVEIWAAPILYYLLTGWQTIPAIAYTLIFIAVGGVVYDFIINLIRNITAGKPSLFYVDNKGFNAIFLRRLTPGAYWFFRIFFSFLAIAISFLIL